MPQLFEPFTLRSVQIRNRIGVSPMCQYSSVEGRATDWHLVHLGSRAIGGAGLIIAEATAVEPRGRITPGCAGLWSDDQIEPLRRITAFIKAHGATPAIQLAHAGRKASSALPWDGGAWLSPDKGGWEAIGASAIAFGAGHPHPPREMTAADIADVQAGFVAAARRALDAGFELLELHSAHGYLMHSFLSPLSNKRRDIYGGSFAGRTRFLLETARAVRRVWPEHLPLAVRLSCSDWVDGGWGLEDSVALAKQLKTEGVDCIDCSSGGTTPDAKIPAGPSFQVPFAEAIRRAAELPTMAVGTIADPLQADEIVRNGRADMVLLAREFLRDAYWPHRAARALRKFDRGQQPRQYAHWIRD